MKIIKKYKWFILGFVIIFVLLVAWIFKDIFLNADGPLYGDRLNGSQDIKLTSNDQNSVKDVLKQTVSIKEVKVNLQGLVFHVVIYVDETATVDAVKNACNSALEKLNAEQKGFYDVSFLVDYEKDTKATNFPISGYKNKNSEAIVW